MLSIELAAVEYRSPRGEIRDLVPLSGGAQIHLDVKHAGGTMESGRIEVRADRVGQPNASILL